MTTAPTKSAKAMVRVRGVSHAYDARRVLHDVSFEVASGEIFGLLGPNGSGKSTALTLLAGLIPAQSGVIEFTRDALAPTDRRLRARSGVVFQHPGLDAKLTAAENLELAARLYGYSGAECARRARFQLEWVGLTDRENEPIGKLSGGMRRRVDIARALLHDPSILFMDEPTVGLDESSFRGVWRHLETMRREAGLTIVLATHRPEEAERCDRLAVLHEGRVATVGTPAELRAAVAADVIVLRGADLALLAEDLGRKFSVSCVYDPEDDELVIDTEAGHALVPRLVEAFPAGRFESVSLRHPSLADAFLKTTGHALTTGDNGEKPA